MKKRHLCTLVGIATLPPVAACLALYWLDWPSASVIDQHVRVWVFGSFGVVCVIGIWWCLAFRGVAEGIAVLTVGLGCALSFSVATALPTEMMVFVEVSAASMMLAGLVGALADYWSPREPDRSSRRPPTDRPPIAAVSPSPQPLQSQLLQQPIVAPENQLVGVKQPAAAGMDAGHLGRRLFLDEGPQA